MSDPPNGAPPNRPLIFDCRHPSALPGGPKQTLTRWSSNANIDPQWNPVRNCKFACNNDPLRGDFRVQ
jgi:hypothetical protein